ncbi:hypothetical protein NDU88_004875 [Pleurodeles waltl]|uniref:Uncharacterized protein n=1 Tax=Pleurodeles waltl TaxID=8319 RepID=A0AAV7SK20_PLEWA|nr:hypothetical protein NDU88_004875 [Pleurodeles waltl]
MLLVVIGIRCHEQARDCCEMMFCVQREHLVELSPLLAVPGKAMRRLPAATMSREKQCQRCQSCDLQFGIVWYEKEYLHCNRLSG